MSLPLVSVVLPAYNHERFIRSAVESVLNQSYRKLELIVIDDASTDGTWEVLEEVQDSRLHKIRHETNQGAHATLNEGIEKACGSYVAIINSDDIYHEFRLERLTHEAEARGERLFWAFTDVDFIDAAGEHGCDTERAKSYERLREICSVAGISTMFLVGNVAVSTSNIFFSRELLPLLGQFRPLRYTHDWDWALRASRLATPVWIQERLLCYRVHESNTLSESDTWRHIHENSYLQSAALRNSIPRSEQESRSACLALLANESLHPLSLMCFISLGLMGVSEGRLLEMAGGDHENWLLEGMATNSGLPPEVFQSLGYLANREKAIAAQTLLIEERWRAIEDMGQEIADRDKWIGELLALLDERLALITLRDSQISERDRVLFERDQTLAERDQMLVEREFRIAEMQTTLDRIYAHPIIRLLRFGKKLLSRKR
jgi:glycosyltransferase involved in cell wall biosynthesis